MVKHIKSLLLAILSLLSFSGCMIRLIQLIKFTDIKTGLVTQEHKLSYLVYALSGLSLLIGFVYSSLRDKRKMPEISNSKKQSILLTFLSISFFWDFIHQCMNCFDYVNNALIIEYTYVFSVAILGIFALLCSVYFYIVSLTARGIYYDFKRLTLFHFCVILWSFMKLLILMLKMPDIVYGAENFCEFILCVMIICLSFSCISAIEKKQDTPGRLLIFSALGTFSMSIIIAVPRLLAYIAGKGSIIHISDFSAVTYLMIGISSLFLAVGSPEKQKEI